MIVQAARGRFDRRGQFHGAAAGQFRRTEFRIRFVAAKTARLRSGGQVRLESLVHDDHVGAERPMGSTALVQRAHLRCEPLHKAEAGFQRPRRRVFEQRRQRPRRAAQR